MKVTKAKEVLRRYAAGERDFRGLNLRGQSFKGADLSDADFSETDLRSTNLTGTTLRKVNFIGAKCGLQKRWVIVGLITTLLLIFISGVLTVFNSALISLIFDSSSVENKVAGWVALAITLIFQIVLLRKGVVAGAGAGAVLMLGVSFYIS